MCESLHCESVFKELHNDQEYYWPITYRAGVACEKALRRALAEGREKGELATTSLEFEFLSYQSANQGELNQH